MVSVFELTCIYSALIIHNEEVIITALANANIESLICNMGPGGPAPAARATPAGGPAAAPAEKKLKAKKEESEESDDNMGLGLFL
ncbi:PREDICTED: 60S acidic ribosomal protein P1-like [Elephantulus edwardii]|uniref:60S acidic ribosomal protein P1-like n=1 Tax=Elephantulus edwardii TaxID=28737 RepID=UPI0003F0A2D6|nr:PREDICTED: 60S acidic ribosomal protein P1-like [Elephantulus edwardii]